MTDKQTSTESCSANNNLRWETARLVVGYMSTV